MMIDLNTKDGKILHYIRSNSTVLEFGSGFGRMTKYMKETLNCNVYIVENDSEAYKSAKQYAAGGICGDIQEFSWIKEFDNITFDHIIFANVLEYMLNPLDVLQKSAALLKEDGSLFVAVPNIAHNSIIYNLINNKFEYKNSGLLNKDSIRFFTHSSLIEMLDACNLMPIIEDGTILNDENIEFKKNGGTIIDKEYASIYQFVFKSVKKKYYNDNKDTMHIHKLYPVIPSFFCVVYFNTGNSFNANEYSKVPLYKKGRHFETTIELTNVIKAIRFDPFEGYACIIDNLQILTDSGAIDYTYTNGIEIDGLILFDTIDPHIAIEIGDKSISRVKISGNMYRFNFDDIALLTKYKNIVKKHLETGQRLKSIMQDYENLLYERDELLNSKSWRLTKPLRKFTALLKRKTK